MKPVAAKQADEGVGIHIFARADHAQDVIAVIKVEIGPVMSELFMDPFQQHGRMHRVRYVCTEYFDHKHDKPTRITLKLRGVNTSF